MESTQFEGQGPEEVVELRQRRARYTLTMSGASKLVGTFSGPHVIGAQRVEILVRSEHSGEWRRGAPAGEGPSQPWAMAIPAPAGTALTVGLRVGPDPIGIDVSTFAGGQADLDASAGVLRIRPTHGDRAWLLGWIELRPVGEREARVYRTYTQSGDGVAESVMPPAGEYRVRHCFDGWGTTGTWAAQHVVIAPGETFISVDVAP